MNSLGYHQLEKVYINEQNRLLKFSGPHQEDDSERGAGQKILKMPNRSGQLYLKVMFEGVYGSVSNKPLLIQQ